MWNDNKQAQKMARWNEIKEMTVAEGIVQLEKALKDALPGHNIVFGRDEYDVMNMATIDDTFEVKYSPFVYQVGSTFYDLEGIVDMVNGVEKKHVLVRLNRNSVAYLDADDPDVERLRPFENQSWFGSGVTLTPTYAPNFYNLPTTTEGIYRLEAATNRAYTMERYEYFTNLVEAFEFAQKLKDDKNSYYPVKLYKPDDSEPSAYFDALLPRNY